MNIYLKETYSQHNYSRSFLTQNIIIKPINKKIITLDIPALCEENNDVNIVKFDKYGYPTDIKFGQSSVVVRGASTRNRAYYGKYLLRDFDNYFNKCSF